VSTNRFFKCICFVWRALSLVMMGAVIIICVYILVYLWCNNVICNRTQWLVFEYFTLVQAVYSLLGLILSIVYIAVTAKNDTFFKILAVTMAVFSTFLLIIYSFMCINISLYYTYANYQIVSKKSIIEFLAYLFIAFLYIGIQIKCSHILLKKYLYL